MILTARELIEETAAGRGPLVEAAPDEPVFVLRASDFESQPAMMAFGNIGRQRWRNHNFLDHVVAVHAAMKNWFAAHNPTMPTALVASDRPSKPAPARHASRMGHAVRRWKAGQT